MSTKNVTIKAATGFRKMKPEVVFSTSQAIYNALNGNEKIPAPPAPFDDVKKSDDVALHVGVRIVDGVAHSRLRAQVHHALKFVAVKQGLHCLTVRKIHLDEFEAWITLQNLQTRLLQRRVVVCVEIVEPDDLITPIEQQPRGVKTDKSRSTGHEQLHSRRHTVLPEETRSSSARI